MNLKYTCKSVVLALTSSIAWAGPGEPKHFDIWLYASGNQIVTGSITEDGTPLNDVHRVFGSELGADLAFPYSAFEPGFQTHGAGFGSSTQLTFTIADPLGAWNGDGFDPADETMTIEFGPQSATSGAGPMPGFDFFTDSAGTLHDHFDFTLNAGANPDPDPGIYLLSLSIAGVSPSYAASDPFYIVFNLGQTEEDHDAAIAWVEENIVPGPSVAWVFAAGLGVKRRRGRSS